MTVHVCVKERGGEKREAGKNRRAEINATLFFSKEENTLE